MSTLKYRTHCTPHEQVLRFIDVNGTGRITASDIATAFRYDSTRYTLRTHGLPHARTSLTSTSRNRKRTHPRKHVHARELARSHAGMHTHLHARTHVGEQMRSRRHPTRPLPSPPTLGLRLGLLSVPLLLLLLVEVVGVSVRQPQTIW